MQGGAGELTGFPATIEIVNPYHWQVPRELADAGSEPISDRFVRLACLTYGSDHIQRRARAQELVSAHPASCRENIYTAAKVGDVATVKEMLEAERSLANRRVGSNDWYPLLYATYSRLNSEAEGLGEYCYALAKLLLEAGADPNDGQSLYNRMFGHWTRHLEPFFRVRVGPGWRQCLVQAARQPGRRTEGNDRGPTAVGR